MSVQIGRWSGIRLRAAAAALTLLALVALPGLAAPRIVVDNNLYEFGSVAEGSLVAHVFRLTNLGDEPLQNLRVRSTCGCTTSTLPSTTLDPGGVLAVEVVFNTTGYGGSTVSKSVYVESNDPATPQLFLRFRGEVRPIEPFNIVAMDLRYFLFVLIDLRSAEAFAERHLIGAVNIPREEMPSVMGLLPPGMLIVVYDEDGSTSDAVARDLMADGYTSVKSLVGGLQSWVRQMGTSFLWPLGQ